MVYLIQGGVNKQYSAQLSFVIEKQTPVVNVGFYFGGAASRNLTIEQRKEQEQSLKQLGVTLASFLLKNDKILNRYNSLFEYGFTAYCQNEPTLPQDWIENIKIQPKNSYIYAKVYPNEFGIIENSLIDFYVAKVAFMMAAFAPHTLDPSLKRNLIRAMSPEQWAKQAERKAQIGLKGEEYILRIEEEKLSLLGLKSDDYPNHIALESSEYGYDILSLSDEGDEIYIEVKTTTRKSIDPLSKTFFMSQNEFNLLKCNPNTYKLIRVYDIENLPTYEEINPDLLEFSPNGLKVNILE